MEENIDTSTSIEEKKFTCTFDGCQAVFGRRNRLEQHIRIHTGERPYKCQIDGCQQSYTRNFHLTRHIQSVHNKVAVPKYQCPVEDCSKLFSTQQNLRRHHNRYHTNQSENICNVCNKSFKKHQQLKIHQFEHTGIKPFKCPHEGCEKSFLQPSKLKAHSKIHAGYTCSTLGCAQHFATWSLLQEHRREAHKKDHSCDTCGKIFTTKATLRDHLRTHQEVRPVFHCPVEGCSRWYYFERNVKMHIRYNHETGHYVCQVEGCGREFTSKGSFKSHIIRHKKKSKSEKTKKVKKVRNVRKDKGVPKKPIATILTGHIVSSEGHFEGIRNVD